MPVKITENESGGTDMEIVGNRPQSRKGDIGAIMLVLGVVILSLALALYAYIA